MKPSIYNAHQEVSDYALLTPLSSRSALQPILIQASHTSVFILPASPGLMGRQGGYLSEHQWFCWMAPQFSAKSWVPGRRLTRVGLPSEFPQEQTSLDSWGLTGNTCLSGYKTAPPPASWTWAGLGGFHDTCQTQSTVSGELNQDQSRTN